MQLYSLCKNLYTPRYRKYVNSLVHIPTLYGTVMQPSSSSTDGRAGLPSWSSQISVLFVDFSSTAQPPFLRQKRRYWPTLFDQAMTHLVTHYFQFTSHTLDAWPQTPPTVYLPCHFIRALQRNSTRSTGLKIGIFCVHLRIIVCDKNIQFFVYLLCDRYKIQERNEKMP